MFEKQLEGQNLRIFCICRVSYLTELDWFHVTLMFSLPKLPMKLLVETVVFFRAKRQVIAKPWYRRLVGEYNNRLFAGISINRPVYKDFNQFGLLDTHMD